jgi:outer membrane protein OmpA-like peptidoglycan-associated protein
MNKITLFFALCFFLSSIQRTAASPQNCDSLKWKFAVNMFAIDGDELMSDLNRKGWNKDFFDAHRVRLIIEGATDCPGSYQYNSKLAQNRALYLRNFFETAGYTEVKIEECRAVPEKGCTKTNQAYNRENRSVSVWLFAEKIEKVQQPEPIIESIVPEETPEQEEVNNLIELEPGQSIVLGGLNFYPGSHKTLPDAKPVMKQLAQLMKENPTLLIEVQGHVCCSKKPDEDGIDDLTGQSNLSWARAKEIYDYLVAQGIDPQRVTYKGYAMKKPLVFPEVTIQDQIKNRRVEVMVVAK